MRISAYWIVKNEEENIASSIKSVRNCVDELLVVDTGSTDMTVEIARGLGARVELFNWNSDFSAARNYALDLVTGDIIVLMDGDEYFYPSLEKKDHLAITTLFDDNPEISGYYVKGNNIDKETGILQNVSFSLRFFRKSKTIRYHGKIHEQLLDSETPLKALRLDCWSIIHTGYSQDVFKKKLKRNISLLNGVLEDEQGKEKRLILHCYLMREHYMMENAREEAYEHMLKLLAEPERLAHLLTQKGLGFAEILYRAFEFSTTLTDRIDRNIIYEGLVVPMQKGLPSSVPSLLLNLWYHAFFCREDAFLQIWQRFLRERSNLGTLIGYDQEILSMLYFYAAKAEIRRCHQRNALDYAITSIQTAGKLDSAPLSVIFTCLKKSPSEEIILLLNKLYDVSRPESLDFLITNTLLDGLSTVHAYYIKKQLDLGFASKENFLVLLLLFQKYHECVSHALSMIDPADKSSTVRAANHIALTTICSNDKQLYLQYFDLLEPYQLVLETYFNDKPLDKITQNDRKIFGTLYPFVVLTVGIAGAERFASVFQNSEECVIAKILYWEKCSLFSRILDSDWEAPASDNLSCYFAVIRSYLMLQKYEELFLFMCNASEAQRSEKEFGDTLMIISEQATPPIASQAKRLYIEIYERK